MLKLRKSALMLLHHCSSGCFHIVTGRPLLSGLSVLCFASFCRVCVWFALCLVMHAVCALIRVKKIFVHTQFHSNFIHSCTDHLSYVPYVDICNFFLWWNAECMLFIFAPSWQHCICTLRAAIQSVCLMYAPCVSICTECGEYRTAGKRSAPVAAISL